MLKGLSKAFYSSMKGVPFPLKGTCRSVVYREHGISKLAMENGYVARDEGFDMKDSQNLVHIKMLAAPINPADMNQIQGSYPLESEGGWHVCGNEGVGVVVNSGQKVRKTLNVGDWVIPSRGAFGTWREQAVCYDSDVQVVPNDLPLETAATLLVNPPTAYRLLTDFGHLQPNDLIIQNGANSSVGRYVIQMAKARGIRTINIIRDRPNYERLEKELIELGATTVVKAEEFAKPETQSYLVSLLNGKPKLGFNCVSGVAINDMSRIMSDGSTIVTYGGMSGKNPVISASSMIFRDIKFVGFWMSNWYRNTTGNPEFEAQRKVMMDEIISWFKNKKLVPTPLKRYSFETEWQKAVNHYSEKSTDLKPILIMNVE